MNILQRPEIRESLNVWGIDAQMVAAAEECAELIQPLLKFVNRKKVDLENIKEEIADVIIMCNQLTYYFGEDEIQKYIDKKLDKLRKKLDRVRS